MNIYQIQQDLITIFDIIEENGGELTPELEEALTITEEEFKDKIQGYTNVIKMLKNDIDNIKTEQKRLKDLSDKKQKTIDKLTSIIIEAIDKFGSNKKSGVKYIDYGTGEVSIRNTKSVDIDLDVVKEIGKAIQFEAVFAYDTNQLDVNNCLDLESIIDFVKDEDLTDKSVRKYNITKEDLYHTDVELSVKVPVSKLLNGEAYPILKEIAKYTQFFTATTSVSKSNIKKELEQNGACAPNIARLINNKSINIK